MDLSSVHYPFATVLVVLFCAFWPFLAMFSVPRRGRSSAPIAAALVALAVIGCGMWINLATIVDSEWSRPAALLVARNTLEMGWIAVWPVAWIAILSLIRRHRPIPDRFVAILAALLGVAAIAALNFAAFLAPRIAYLVFARAAAAFALAIALAAAVWLFVVTRRQAPV
jgi:hypothetical protein